MSSKRNMQKFRRVGLGVLALALVAAPTLPSVAWAVQTNVDFQLEVTSLALAGPAATSPTTGGPGGNGPPGVPPPRPEAQPIVAGEEGAAPYVAILEVQGVAVPPGLPLDVAHHFPTFRGKTNLKDALIFVRLDAESTISTVFADVSGIWVYRVPAWLQDGWHTLTFVAKSPINPSLQAEGRLQIRVVTSVDAPPIAAPPQPPVPAVPVDTARPPGVGPALPPPPSLVVPVVPPVPPVPLPPVTPSLVTPPRPPAVRVPTPPLGVEVVVEPGHEQMVTPGLLPIRTTIRPLPGFPPGPVQVRTTITDRDGRLVYDRTRTVDVRGVVRLQESVVVPPLAVAGGYQVNVEVVTDGVRLQGSDRFTVATPTPSLLFGLVGAVTRPEGAGPISARLWLLAALLVGFALALLLEFIAARRGLKVNPTTLRRGSVVK